MSRTTLAATLLALLLASAGCSGASAAPAGVPLRFATPTPSPTPPPRVLGAFVTNFAEAKPPFHAKAMAVGKAAAGTGEWSSREAIEYDAQGTTMRALISLESPMADPIVMDVVTFDGKAYAQFKFGGWNELSSLRHIQPIDPFATLDPWDLEYVSEFIRDGRTLHRLRTTRWVGEGPERSEIEDAKISATTFSLTVDDGGLPVDAELEFTVTGVENGRPISREFRSTYEFSAIGKPVDIAKPVVQPTASPKPTAEPNAKARSRIVRSFVDGFVTKDTPFHAVGRMVIDTDFTDFGVKMAIEFEMDIDGEDYSAAMRFNPLGESNMSSETIRLDGVMYSRASGGRWTVIDSVGQAEPPSPFASLSPEAIEYVGTVRRDGRTLHRLVASGWADLPSGQELLADARVSSSSFSIFVDDKGRPVAVDLTLTITGTYGASRQPTELKYEASYTFSAIGKPIRIVRPKTGDAPTAVLAPVRPVTRMAA